MQSKAGHPGAMADVAVIIDAPISNHSVKIVAVESRLDQGVSSIDPGIEQTNGRHVPARPSDALGEVLDEIIRHSREFIGEHRGRVGRTPDLGNASGRKQQQFDRGAATMDRENDHLRKAEPRVVASDGQPQALSQFINPLYPICEAPERPPHFCLRIVWQGCRVVTPEGLEAGGTDMLDRLDAGFLGDLVPLHLGERIVTKDRVEDIACIIGHEERDTADTVRGDGYSPLPCSFALAFESRRPHPRRKLNLKIDSIGGRRSVRQIERFSLPIRRLKSGIKFSDHPAAVLFTDALKSSLARIAARRLIVADNSQAAEINMTVFVFSQGVLFPRRTPFSCSASC